MNGKRIGRTNIGVLVIATKEMNLFIILFVISIGNYL